LANGSKNNGRNFGKVYEKQKSQEKVEDSSYDVTRAEKAGGIDPPAFNYDFEIASRIDKS
jgi:hypothetical protein